MKYKITIVVIISALVLGGSIFESVYIEKTFDNFDKIIENIMAQDPYSLDDVEDALEWWDDKTEKLEISVSVLQLNEISFTLGELKGAVECGDRETAMALLNRIYQYSQRIRDMYRLKINNIM
jgi:hypothetical protein